MLLSIHGGMVLIHAVEKFFISSRSALDEACICLILHGLKEDLVSVIFTEAVKAYRNPYCESCLFVKKL